MRGMHGKNNNEATTDKKRQVMLFERPRVSIDSDHSIQDDNSGWEWERGKDNDVLDLSK